MKILESLLSPVKWEEFYRYRTENSHLTKSEEKDLGNYIENSEYIPVVERIRAGADFPLPEKHIISKSGTSKKRTVYTFPRAENYVLKAMTFYLTREYDSFFAESLYSFRVNSGVHKAIGKVLDYPKPGKMYTYKADISNYFNSIPVRQLIPMIYDCTDDTETADFITFLLKRDSVLYDGNIITEQKGVMAGTPFAGFLANIYLSDMDRYMEKLGFRYSRYSDDIILFTYSREERDRGEAIIKDFLDKKGLFINPQKEERTEPGETWQYLGIQYSEGRTDISAVSFDKLKGKIRRKARALRRWQVRKGATGEQAAKAFIRKMNRKFFDADISSELTWTRWYFPVINTDETLKKIDEYMQYWIRWLVSGTHSKASYRVKYSDIKALGYISLVNAWYKKDTLDRKVQQV